MKNWYQSKTIQFALLKILGGALTAVQTQSWEPLIVSAMGVIDILLRAVTKEPIGKTST